MYTLLEAATHAGTCNRVDGYSPPPPSPPSCDGSWTFCSGSSSLYEEYLNSEEGPLVVLEKHETKIHECLPLDGDDQGVASSAQPGTTPCKVLASLTRASAVVHLLCEQIL